MVWERYFELEMMLMDVGGRRRGVWVEVFVDEVVSKEVEIRRCTPV